MCLGLCDKYFGNRIVELKDGWITGTEGAVVR